MPIPQDATMEECMRVMMEDYNRTKMIGNTKPNNPAHARQIASAACYNKMKQAPPAPVQPPAGAPI